MLTCSAGESATHKRDWLTSARCASVRCCRMITAQHMVPWTGKDNRHRLQPAWQVLPGCPGMAIHLGTCR